MRSWMKLLASNLPAFALAISLGGCATTVGLIPPNDLYPQALTTCVDEPVLAERADKILPRADREKAQYVKGLRSAYLDCKDTVSGWADRRALYTKQYDTKTNGYFTNLWRSVTGTTSN